jgi:hypothetical protein
MENCDLFMEGVYTVEGHIEGVYYPTWVAT